MKARSPVLAVHIVLVPLPLRHDVVLAQKMFRHLAKCLFGFEFSSAKLPPKLEIPVLGDILGFGEALFLRAGSTILAREIA